MNLFRMVATFSLVCIMCLNALSDDTFKPYLGQKLPGSTPELFAPGIISTGLYERDMAIMPDGKEIYFSVSLGNNKLTKIAVCRFENGKWTQPEIAEFSNSPDYNDIEPCTSPDGKSFYFVSNRPNTSGPDQNYDIWVMDREKNSWGIPRNLGEPVNTSSNEYFPSVTENGTMYFTARHGGEKSDLLFRCRMSDGTYQPSEKLGKYVNCGTSVFNAYIAPDESYLILCTFVKNDSVGSIDYYIVFRKPDDTWSKPVNLGNLINTDGFLEYSPYVTSDGQFFFFMSARMDNIYTFIGNSVEYSDLLKCQQMPENSNPDIYWVNTDFIKKLKQKAVWED